MKQQIIDMRFNTSRIRDTARVLRISTDTVLRELRNWLQVFQIVLSPCSILSNMISSRP